MFAISHLTSITCRQPQLERHRQDIGYQLQILNFKPLSI